MRVLITGAGGIVGRFVAEALAGHEAIELGRRPSGGPAAGFVPWELGAEAALPEAEALVHLALDHVPGAYRGGEGADPAGFWRRNVEGSARLFEAAAGRGARRIVFLSSRAVYGGHPPGARAREEDAVAPDTLYGEAKLASERFLDGMGVEGISLRATGIYGWPPRAATHKWADLFGDFRAGRSIAPRVATEVHGADLAAAVTLALTAPVPEPLYNVSDLLLDRHDLLGEFGRLAGIAHPPPPRADGSRIVAMETDRLRGLGWQPGGWERLREELGRIAEDIA